MNSTNSLALILIATGIFFFFTKPQMNALSATLAKKAEYQDALDKINSIEEIKQSLTDKINSLTDVEKAQIQTLLPDSLGAVKLVSDMNAVAGKYSISLDQVSSTVQNNDNVDSVSGALISKNYKSTLINFSFRSDYSHLKGFLKDLESSMRLIDIRSIDISTDPKGVYNYRVTAEVYYLE